MVDSSLSKRSDVGLGLYTSGLAAIRPRKSPHATLPPWGEDDPQLVGVGGLFRDSLSSRGPSFFPFLLDPMPARSQQQRACEVEGRTIYRKYWCLTLKIGFLLTLVPLCWSPTGTAEASAGNCDLSAPCRLGDQLLLFLSPGKVGRLPPILSPRNVCFLNDGHVQPAGTRDTTESQGLGWEASPMPTAPFGQMKPRGLSKPPEISP